ncbi:hypothetical protein HGO53_04720 [Wolbachia endosymbiont of Diaphorina citri]|jgi:hypothetical protein|uniref:hypothetical protein n=1 Tax=Wolbachia endosymbiont of Diaphorina citri TaxID=116598 RepID=UPI0002EF93BA|nr:hypothetical protein [Wolbachia endosymbiont of Diaphorina citri]QJT94552.1 hypothetical protein HGO48_04010 [Wolbachia endosymbiont of Diaphorina citri]QJT95792.1 hypothetical protein HGO49_04010 [Wolbachia endosymbiont of Diaphorina citri]QJT97154.1 hypothetical protein HGO53_04720 [Wolbachia endosymbiont of Diaphorina citri]QLK11450.1 hypothetical protein FK497_04070 [Wolbachia endosymbiont of Diaphorina citri]QXY87017.1 hypothetical protein GZ064_03560 [Wolbachia endosymbiont of Diaphor
MEQQASHKEKGINFRQNQCKQKCYSNKEKRTDPDCLNKCLDKYSSEVFKPYSQISEKLEASENNFYDESKSTKLPLMADILDVVPF